MSRLTCRERAGVLSVWLILAGLGGLLAALPGTAGSAEVSEGSRVEIVVTGIPRPIQLARDGDGMLVVLGQGWRGDSAGELYRVDLRGTLPVDDARALRVVVPFASEPRKTALGSLAVDPHSGDLFLGEENGNRIYRLGSTQHLRPVAVGLNHLLGGSTLALDHLGRLVFLDYASPETHLRAEAPLPPSLSWLTEEGYRGPVVFRVDVHADRPLPRRADLLAPIFPRSGAISAGREPLWRLIGSDPTASFASWPDCPPATITGRTSPRGQTGACSSVADFIYARSSGSPQPER